MESEVVWYEAGISQHQSPEAEVDVLQDCDATGLLIELIQRYEFLYDLSHRDYKNTLKKDLAWREIAEVLNIRVEECQKLWKALRDRYTREKREESKSGSEAPISKWFYYSKMLFYNKYSRTRKTYTTTPKSSMPEALSSGRSSSCSVWSNVDNLMSPVLSPPSVPDDVSLIDEGERSVGVADDRPIIEKTAQTPKAKKKKVDDETTEILQAAKQIASQISKSSQDSGNPNRTFVEYVFSLLEEMSPEMSRSKRMQILQLLDE